MRTSDQLATGRSAHLFLQFYDAKIKQFENGIVVRKCAAFCHLAKTGIDRLNGIGRVHNLANRRRIVKKLFDVGKTTFPDGNHTRIFTPNLSETLEFDAASFEAWCTVNFFQVSGEDLVIARRDIL